MPSYHPLLISLEKIRSRLIELPTYRRTEWLTELLNREEHCELLAALCKQNPKFKANLAQSEKDGLTLLLSRQLLVLPAEYMVPKLTIQEMLAESQAALAKKLKSSPSATAPLAPSGQVSEAVTTINHWSGARARENRFYPISHLPELLSPLEKMAQSVASSSTRSPHSAMSLFSPQRDHSSTSVGATGLTAPVEMVSTVSKSPLEADLKLFKASHLREKPTELDHKRNMEELVDFALQKTLNLKEYLASHNIRTIERVIAAIQYAFQTREHFGLNKSQMRRALRCVGISDAEMIEAKIIPARDRSTKAKDAKRTRKKENVLVASEIDLPAKESMAKSTREADPGKKEKRSGKSGPVGGAGVLFKNAGKKTKNKKVRSPSLFPTGDAVAPEESALLTDARGSVGEATTLIKRKGKKRPQREDSSNTLGCEVTEGRSMTQDGGEVATPETTIKRTEKKRAKKEEDVVLLAKTELSEPEAPVSSAADLLLFATPIIKKEVKKLRTNELVASSSGFKALIDLIIGGADENTKIKIELLLADSAKMNLLNIVSHWLSAPLGTDKDHKNDWGFTPLAFAAKYCKNADVIQLLIDKNRDNIHRVIKDRYNELFDGKTAVEIAIAYKNIAFLKVYSATMGVSFSSEEVSAQSLSSSSSSSSSSASSTGANSPHLSPTTISALASRRTSFFSSADSTTPPEVVPTSTFAP